MKNKNFYIIIGSFILFIMNVFVFFAMNDYVVINPNFMNQLMYYLTFIMIIGSGIISYVGYRDLSTLSVYQRVCGHIIFWLHILGLAMFLGTVWFVLAN